MRRTAIFAAVFVVLSVLLVVAQSDDTTAQDAMATHPIVGAWRFTNDLGGGVVFPSLAIFHADGTYIEDFPDESSYSMGVWEATGERTIAATGYQVYVVDDKLVNGENRFTAEVDETGNALVSTGSFLGLFEDGSVEFAVEGGEGVSPAVRLAVQPIVPLAEQMPAGTPTP